MFRLRHLFSKYLQLQEQTDTPELEVEHVNSGDINTYTPRLPTELWILIISHVEGNREMLVLGQVSSVLRRLILPSFKSVHLFPQIRPEISREKILAELKVLRVIQLKPLATIVTNLWIRLFCIPGPRNTIPACMCGQLDDMMHVALQAMCNLEELELHCNMCIRNGRHLCFSQISSQRLRTLSFQCNCSSTESFYPEQVLLFEVLSTLEALRWRCSPRVGYATPLSWTTLQNPEVLSKLNAIAYHGKDMETKLLAARAIPRVFVAELWETTDGERQFMQVLNGSEGGLTHIIFNSFLKLRDIVEVTPHCFTNVQHIGTVPPVFTDTANTIESYLLPFVSLHNLTSIDVLAFGDGDPWNIAFLVRLREAHQNLRRVLVEGGRSCIWEFQTGVWQVKMVARFSPWDIIRGACDQM